VKNKLSSILENDIKIFIGIGIFLSLIFLLITNDLKVSIVVLLASIIFMIIWSSLIKYFGYKRHKNIIKSDGFQDLIRKGFKIEQINKYIGLTGEYEGYICDIYYNWETFVMSGLSKAIVVVIYFTPPKPLHKVHCANYEFLIKVKSKYNKGLPLGFGDYSLYWQEGALHVSSRVWLRNPNKNKIENRIKKIIGILKNENLQPINRTDLTNIRNNFKFQSVPEISLYFEKP